MDLLNRAMADADHDGQPDAAALVGGLLGQFGAHATGGDPSPSPANALAGIGGLVDALQKAGLTDQVASWISMGGANKNQPVDPQALGEAIGPDKLADLANRIGLPIDRILPTLATALPTVIDALTPDGKVPDAGSADLGSVLGGLLGGNR
jgi:uncharacterized protein YidB (DUF937 family)